MSMSGSDASGAIFLEVESLMSSSFAEQRRAAEQAEGTSVVGLTAGVRSQRRNWRAGLLLAPLEEGEEETDCDAQRRLFLKCACELLELANAVDSFQSSFVDAEPAVDCVLSSEELREQAEVYLKLVTPIARLQVAHPADPPRGYWIRRFLLGER